jgi:hypothetical protein
MERSVTQSVSGHLQVYSADAKDKIALFGDEFAGMPDIGVIPDFGALATIIRKVPNVRSVVPMGIDFALGSSGNELDRWLARLRQAVRDNDKRLIAQRKEEVRAVCEAFMQRGAPDPVLVRCICTLFCRIVDLENLMPEVLDHASLALSRPFVREDVMHRLGALNVLSPVFPDGSWAFDLAAVDEREAAPKEPEEVVLGGVGAADAIAGALAGANEALRKVCSAEP